MNIDFCSINKDHPLGESATNALAHFCGCMAVLILLVDAVHCGGVGNSDDISLAHATVFPCKEKFLPCRVMVELTDYPVCQAYICVRPDGKSPLKDSFATSN